MSYRERQRLADIQAAIDAIRSHLQRGDLADGLIFDAVRIRLLEIGEAVKALPDDLLATQPSIPWRQITRMRDHLAHRYFDTAHAILQATVGFAQISLLAGAGAGAEVTFDSAWSLRPGTDADRPTSLGR
jgi:uncharacterized protein with HEPN domain